MSKNKESVIEIAQQYAKLIRDYVNPEKIILYGSYATGNQTEDSDIDIAVIMKSIPDDYLAALKLLNRLTRNIDKRIEPIILDENDDISGFLSTIYLSGFTLFDNKV
jgi:predicted nucleotidyltransferase